MLPYISNKMLFANKMVAIVKIAIAFNNRNSAAILFKNAKRVFTIECSPQRFFKSLNLNIFNVMLNPLFKNSHQKMAKSLGTTTSFYYRIAVPDSLHQR